MREFRPPVRPSVLRTVLAVVLPLVVLFPMGGLVLLATGATQARYTIADGALVVKSGDWLAGQRSVLLADVTEARRVALHGARRTSGTALPGYCAGRFSYPDLGQVWQATDCSGRAVLVRARGAELPIVITPPDPDAFVEALHARTPTDVTLPAADKGSLRAIAFTVAPIMIIIVLMVSALMLIGPSRMVYLVGDGALEVRTLFGKKRWPTAGARAKAYTPSRMWRVAGTAVPGYYTGRFRESGQGTRVYATAIDRVVLFEGADRVIVSPEDRVEMLRALEAEGATIERHV